VPNMAQTDVCTCLCMQGTYSEHFNTFLIGYRSGGTPDEPWSPAICQDLGPWPSDRGPPAILGASWLLVSPAFSRRWVSSGNTFCRGHKEPGCSRTRIRPSAPFGPLFALRCCLPRSRIKSSDNTCSINLLATWRLGFRVIWYVNYVWNYVGFTLVFVVVLSLESYGAVSGVIIYENRTTTSQVCVQLSIVSGVD
jgi:hypothetical protein